jgi:hypothetical protein
MAAATKLERFTLEETEDGYLLHVGSDDGQAIQVAVTAEQIDAILDALNEALSDEDDEIFDDEDEVEDEVEDEDEDVDELEDDEVD